MAKDKYIRDTVLNFFNGDEEKTDLWFSTPNPGLGDIKPNDCSEDILYKFVREAAGHNDIECEGCQ